MNRPAIDLRSDALTLPTDAMWEAMRTANLGWASAGEDVSVRELETIAAALAGKETAVLVPTGALANLVALMCHAEPGDQVVLGENSHVLWCEEGAFARVCQLTHTSVSEGFGRIRDEDLTRALTRSIYRHRPRSSVVCLENTDNLYGEASSAASIGGLAKIAHEHGAKVHLDGARVLNACAAVSEPLSEVLAEVDSVMFSLNKGLSAPGGAILAGTAEFATAVRENLRRLCMASVHQHGIYAAAGLVALREMVPQLALDNRRAAALSQGLRAIDGIRVDYPVAGTNIVVVQPVQPAWSADVFLRELAQRGVRGYASHGQRIRFVTHRHISDQDIATAVATVADVVALPASGNTVKERLNDV